MRQRARMRFHGTRRPQEQGEAVLWEDGTFQILPSPPLREAIRGLAGRADQAALSWGASLLMGLAALGAAAFMRGKRGGGYALFGAAGATGVAGALARRGVRTLPAALLAPHPVERVTLLPDEAGGFGWRVDGMGPAKLTMRFGPGEFDPGEARSLRAAVEAAKREGGK